MNNVQVGSGSPERRSFQRDRLVACAETAVELHGLAALRARDLAACVGCSVGAIYNLVADLDQLALLVAQRTMADLNARLAEASPVGDASTEAFVDLALAYCRFAVANRNRWRALFDLRLPRDAALPAWLEDDQMRLFGRLEDRLGHRVPQQDEATLRLRARTLFSAVHGIVTLGLEEKIVAMPIAALEDELAAFVKTYLAGLTTSP